MEIRETSFEEVSRLLPVGNNGEEAIMVGKDLHERIKEMFRSGKKKKAIARLLGVGIKTVRKILGSEEWAPYQRELEKEPLLAPFLEWIGLRASEVEYNARVLYRELKEKGLPGEIRYCPEISDPFATGKREQADDGSV